MLFRSVVARQLNAEFIAQLGDCRDADRAVEMQVQVNFGKLFEVHGGKLKCSGEPRDVSADDCDGLHLIFDTGSTGVRL